VWEVHQLNDNEKQLKPQSWHKLEKAADT